jgi:hypothetical protein
MKRTLRSRWRRPASLQPPLDWHGVVIAGSCLSLNKAILTEQTEQAHTECDGRSGPMK